MNRPATRATRADTVLRLVALAVMLLVPLAVVLYQQPRNQDNPNDPEARLATDTFTPAESSGGALHVRRYQSCTRSTEVSRSQCFETGAYEVRYRGKRRSTASAGMPGPIKSHFRIDGAHLLLHIDGAGIVLFNADDVDAGGSGFTKLNIDAGTPWYEIEVATNFKPPRPGGFSRRSGYFLAGQMLFDVRQMTVTPLPAYRPVFFHDQELYFLEHKNDLVSLYAMKLPGSKVELVDRMLAACFAHPAAALQRARDEEEVLATFADTQLGYPYLLNETRAAAVFIRMLMFHAHGERITFADARRLGVLAHAGPPCDRAPEQPGETAHGAPMAATPQTKVAK